MILQGKYFYPNSLMRKLRLREVRQFAQASKASKFYKQDSISNLCNSKILNYNTQLKIKYLI